MKNIVLSAIALSLAASTDFDGFKKNMEGQIAVIEAEATTDIVTAVPKKFDPMNLSDEMAKALRITNGMPEWLIQQRYDDWVLVNT